MTKERGKSIVAIVAGIFLILNSLLVLIGWDFKSQLLINLLPNYSEMAFNTALCIFGIGIVFLLLPTKYMKIARVISILIALFSLLTALQYFLHLDFHIDEFFKKQVSGRMSLQTAGTLFLSAVALVFLCYKDVESVSLVSLILACFILVVPLINFFGFILGLDRSAWADFSRMPLFTAVNCAFIGIAILIWGVINSLESRLQLFAFPIAAALAVLIGTLAVWQAFRTQEFETVKEIAKKQADLLSQSINSVLREDADTLNRMAQRWITLKGYSDELWAIDSKNLMESLLALTSIQIFDENFELVEQIVNPSFQSIKVGKNFLKEMPEVKKGKTVYHYLKSHDLLLIMIPLIVDYHFEGVLVGTIHLNTVFKKVIQNLDLESSSYQIYILDQNVVIYSGKDPNSQRVGMPITREFGGNLISLDLRIFTTEKSIREEASYLSLIVLIAGIVMMFLLGFIIYFALSVKKKKSVLEIVNQDLKIAKEKSDEAVLAKSAFLATMSHEIRTPLNAVIGTIQLLAETHITETQARYIKRIANSSKALLNLVNEILDFSKIETAGFKLERAPCDLIELLKDIYEDCIFKAREQGLYLLVDCPDQPIAEVMVDAHRLHQVITNLLTNAFKFTEKGGVTLKLTWERVNASEAYLRFGVIDTGIGVSEEDLDKLFLKFSQIESSHSRRFGGVGLGLSICKSLVTKMQGEIGATSQKGKGSTFWFEIPCDLVSAPPPPYDLKQFKLSLLDSFKEEGEVLTRYLTSWNAKIETSGALAILSSDLKEEVKDVPTLIIENYGYKGENALIRPVTPDALWKAIQKRMIDGLEESL